MHGGNPAGQRFLASQRTGKTSPRAKAIAQRRRRLAVRAAARGAFASYLDLVWLLIGVAIIFILSEWIEV